MQLPEKIACMRQTVVGRKRFKTVSDTVPGGDEDGDTGDEPYRHSYVPLPGLIQQFGIGNGKKRDRSLKHVHREWLFGPFFE